MSDVSLADRAEARADDRISFYGPHPTAGTVVRCVVNATEIGDVVVRAKYRFFESKTQGGLAAGLDVRLARP